MIKVYFDDVLIDTDSYVQLDNDYKLFTDSFKLGSVASDTFSLGVIKNAVSTQPINVRIEDDTTIFNFVVDKIVEDDNVYTYSLTDKLLNFNFEYDASILINDKATNEEECYLSDIWKDMCNQANVEYDETYVFENDIVVNWYDNRVQARRYLSFIAELQSGYACILENGKQSFKKQKRSSVKTIDADECSDLIVGEKKKITRVVFDGGAFKWEFGDDTGETLYLQSDNVYIVNEDIVENIYNNINGFEFYIINCPQAPMDSTVKAGDVITFNDNGKLYPTIAQYSMSYAGSWSGGYKLQVNTERQQETQVTRTSQQVRNIQTKVDRLNNEFSIVAEEIEKLTDYIKNVGTTGNYLKLTDTPKSGGAINKLSIKGFNLMPLYPGMAYPSEYTFPGVLNFYTLIFDTVNTFDNNPHYIYINSPVPLQKLGSVYDELLIEANKVKVIQRIGYDFINEQWSVLSSPITHELNDVLLPTFEGDTYISVRYFDNLVYNAEYLIKNDLTSNFTTQLESSSQFKLNQNEIEAKVNKDGIISEINLSPESANINSNKISLEGKKINLTSDNIEIISNNFSVNSEGNVIMVSAELTGGLLKIGNKEIFNSSGVLTLLQFISANGDTPLGWFYDGAYHNMALNIDYIIPSNFVIENAYVTLYHIPCKTTYFDGSSKTDWGYSRDIKLYKLNNTNLFLEKQDSAGVPYYGDMTNVTEIKQNSTNINAFGSNGFTADIPTDASHNAQTVNSENMGSSLSSNESGMLIVKTSQATPTTYKDSIIKTGYAFATLNVIGYYKIT